ncbi:MAG: hypothetical protein ACI4PS_01555 [Rhodocyclaceae bacterium]
MENNYFFKGSTANNPDLSWSQVRETVVMLELASTQIEYAMNDSNKSVDILATSFTELANTMTKICNGFAKLVDYEKDNTVKDSELQETKKTLQTISSYANSLIIKAIVAFQFYDKLAQRISHVNGSLSSLRELVSDGRKIFQPEEWVNLQQKIKSKYSTPEEIAMFDAVVNGMPIQEAIEKYCPPQDEEENIELF